MDHVTPGDILDIAETNPFVKSAILLWKHSEVTWEQAMMQAVVSLSRRASHLACRGLAEAAQETQELNAPISLTATREVMKESNGGLPVTLSEARDFRIQYYKEHGHWPENAPTRK